MDVAGCLHCSMGDCLLLLWQHKGLKNSKWTIFFRHAVLTLPLFKNHRLSWDILMVFSHGLSLEYFFWAFCPESHGRNLTLSNRSASFKNWTLRNKSVVIILWLCSWSCNTAAKKIEGAGKDSWVLVLTAGKGWTPLSIKYSNTSTSPALFGYKEQDSNGATTLSVWSKPQEVNPGRTPHKEDFFQNPGYFQSDWVLACGTVGPWAFSRRPENTHLMRTAGIHCPAIPFCERGWRKSYGGMLFGCWSCFPEGLFVTLWNGDTIAVNHRIIE